MQRITSILILLVGLALLPVAPATAGFFDDTLVSIDGNSYSVDDFKHWWKFWNDDNSPLPKTPDPYIDWLLLSREAERMNLASAPGFNRQTRVFIQSRTLLLLKNDEVNSRINVTDADIKARYNDQFQPRWLIQRLEFKDQNAAMAAWQELAEGTLTVDELLGRNLEQGGPQYTNKGWTRPTDVDPGWTALFQKIEVGEVVDPNEHNKGHVLYYLKDQKGGDEEDFDKLREGIRKKLWKEQETRLTVALLDKLRNKYQIKVNEERLAALDINGPHDTFTDAAIITSSRQDVSEKEFMVVIGKLIASRPTIAHDAADEEKVQKMKAETAANIIGQSVVNWESLDRHYEEKEPFKWEYEFNTRHRLILALEKRLFVSEAEPTEDEIKQHYEKNTGRYTQPSLVELYIIDETQGPIDQIWADVAVGKNFQQVVKENSSQPLKPQEAPTNHLDPEVREVVNKLIEGETSQIFSAQGIRVMVHLIEYTPEAPLPFDRVKKSISTTLWRENLSKLRSTYIDTLKSGSEIEVRERKWKKIQKELGGT